MSKTETQSEALRLAEMLEKGPRRQGDVRIAAVLLGLDAENKALREKLEGEPAGAEVSAYAVGSARIERVAQSRGGFKWAVREFGEVLNLEGEWESEPSPSARDDEFLMRCRFDTAQQAIDAAIATQAAAKNGGAA
ncbi:hypothetical protein [Delftia sp. RIT313]|uniref:hypothetical protein n=1 Tax=Delftia sp. RIT313 TaxID=1468410 RepID=UPI000449B67C|nr:hypothetical protein [Delftia sp. RIT313]EZP51418.1 hypothetical protein BW39_03887 [Delftia sp. RIT313]